MNREQLMNVLLAPHVTEKTSLAMQNHNQYTFRVRRDATKTDIKQAVELMFDVKVSGVQVVNDAALTASPGSNLSGTEGQAIPASVVATFTDANPNGVAGDFTATIDWGDGSTSAGTVSTRIGGGFQVSGGHTYADAGTYSVTVTITDTKGGSTATASLSAAIADVPLQLTAGSSLTATAGQPFNGVVATFVDPTGKEPVAEYTATIDWGDGSQSAGTVIDPPGSFSISGSHTYASAGSFTVSVSVREVDPNASAAVSAAGTMTVSAAAAPNTTAPGRPQPLLLFAALAALLLLLAGLGGLLWARRRTAALR